jgi:hypothetical protein
MTRTMLAHPPCRRHFARHVSEPEDSPISTGEGVSAADQPRIGTDHLDGHAILEASTKALTEMMENLVRQHRDVVGRNPREAERLLGVFMKVQAALARSLKQRDEGRARREQFRKSVRPIIDRITSAAVHSIVSVMRENGKKVRDDFFEVANQRQTVEKFWAMLSSAEDAWAIEVATRMRAATDEAFRAEEAKVQE